jgi:glycosyltransferase involved in cell wall biosynthesis
VTRVLYLDHTAHVGGAERSLLDLLRVLPSEVQAAVACPSGPLAGRVRDLGIPVIEVPESNASLRLHPWYTVHGCARMLAAALAVRVAAHRMRADVVHANSVRAGLVAVLASRMGGAPAVVHVRDCLPPTRTSRLIRRIIGRGAAAVLANSAHTAASFQTPGQGPPRVLDNAIDLSRFQPGLVDRGEARRRLGLDDEAPVLAVVGQFTPWKAQSDAIRMVGVLRDTHPTVRLLVVGDVVFGGPVTRFDHAAYRRDLERLVSDASLAEQVRFLGQREDVAEVMAAVDVLLVPSWEEPFGRTVIEGMSLGIPVVATSVGGPAEVITSGVDGILCPPRQPERWASAVAQLIGDDASRSAMGHAARTTVARRFAAPGCTTALLEVYADAVERAARGGSPELAGSSATHRVMRVQHRLRVVIKPLLVGTGRRPTRVRRGWGRGVVLLLDRRSELQKEFGLYETELHPIYRRAIGPGSVVYDIGAADGDTAIPFAHHGPRARVIAFEPDGELLARFRLNLLLNPDAATHVTLHQCLLGADDDAGPVHTRSIDSLIAAGEVPAPDFVKVDVEGGEAEVLRGMTDTLASAHPTLAVEVHSVELERECVAILERSGYRVSVVGRAMWRRLYPEYRPIAHNRWIHASASARR